MTCLDDCRCSIRTTANSGVCKDDGPYSDQLAESWEPRAAGLQTAVQSAVQQGGNERGRWGGGGRATKNTNNSCGTYLMNDHQRILQASDITNSKEDNN